MTWSLMEVTACHVQSILGHSKLVGLGDLAIGSLIRGRHNVHMVPEGSSSTVYLSDNRLVAIKR